MGHGQRLLQRCPLLRHGGLLLHKRIPFGIQRLPGGLQLLALLRQLRLRGIHRLVHRRIPQGLRSLQNRRWCRCAPALLCDRPRAAALELRHARPQGGKPFFQYGADGVGRAATNLLPHPLDRGALALQQ
ncbi:hypothetical protein D3C72_1083430 [compost metagenome]